MANANNYKINGVNSDVAVVNGEIKYLYLSDQQFIEGKSGFINPAANYELLKKKRKEYQDNLAKQNQIKNQQLSDQAAINQINSAANTNVSNFDITEQDKQNASISKRLLGINKFLVPKRNVGGV